GCSGTTAERLDYARGRRTGSWGRRSGQRHSVNGDHHPILSLQEWTEPLQLGTLVLLLDELFPLLLQQEILLLVAERRRPGPRRPLRAATQATTDLLRYRGALLGRESLQNR
ncbi:MAG: hypothetical protein ACTHL7_05435, partial [Steroidobacteraceae bacterium]